MISVSVGAAAFLSAEWPAGFSAANAEAERPIARASVAEERREVSFIRMVSRALTRGMKNPAENF